MTVAQWLERAVAFLDERGVPEARASAEFLLAEAMGAGRAAVLAQGGRPLDDKAGHRFWRWIKERGRREPLAYILGWQPFLDLRVEISRDCLIPRPETEELALECARLLRESGEAAPKIVEIGTGTGCVAVALARLLAGATVYATDVSAAALELARRNALAHRVQDRVRLIREDMFSGKPGLRGWADLVVSNPPYIPTRELANLAAEVRREPALALDGGRDGLDAVRAIVPSAARTLKPGGTLALEIGARQGAAVLSILSAAGLAQARVKKDAQGRDRMAFARRAAE